MCVCAAFQQDHVLPMSGRWVRRSECVVVQVSSKITYTLWLGDGRDRVSAWLCRYPARSRTSCGRAMGETESVPGCACIEEDHVHSVVGRRARPSQCVGCAGIEQNHVLSVSGRWARRCECLDVQVSRKITYNLWAGDGRDGVSAWMCRYRGRSRTGWGWTMGETV